MSNPRLPSELSHPTFLMNVPFSYATTEANNVWMEEYENRTPDFAKAFAQFNAVYSFLASEAIVYLLPSEPDRQLQDLVFVANLGIALHHKPDTIILSRFTSPPRRGEEQVGLKFFQQIGYDHVIVSPYEFEGEAELKHLHDNVYIGGYGIRSRIEAYQWMEHHYDMQVIKVVSDDDYLYHLDCLIFPLTQEKTLVCTDAFSRQELKEIEKETEIIPVTEDDCLSGLTNSVRLNNLVLNASNIHQLKAGTHDYKAEKAKNRKLEDICSDNALEPCFFDLSEYMKGGALLSCMVMHLNRFSYEVELI